MIELQCAECRVWQPEECFARDSTYANGRRSKCKSCRNEEKAERKRKTVTVQRETQRTTEAWREQRARDLSSLAKTWLYPVDSAQLIWSIR